MSTDKEKTDEPEKSKKNVLTESTQQLLLEKWIDISLDTDRQLLTLSTASIGLLVSFLINKELSSIFQLALISVSSISFLFSIGSVLTVFHLNRSYLDTVLKKQIRPDESLMKALDKLARYSFVFGIITAAFFAFSIATSDLEKTLKSNSGEQRNEQPKHANVNRTQQEPRGTNNLIGNQRELSGDDVSEPNTNASTSTQPSNSDDSSQH